MFQEYLILLALLAFNILMAISAIKSLLDIRKTSKQIDNRLKNIKAHIAYIPHQQHFQQFDDDAYEGENSRLN